MSAPAPSPVRCACPPSGRFPSDTPPLRQLTGRETAALDPVYLAWPQADQYQFAWTGADDEGELACCGTLLYDGTTCYTLTIRCAAELEKTYHAEFARILAHTRLTDAA